MSRSRTAESQQIAEQSAPVVSGLREYLKLRYSAPPDACKCGNCQLIPVSTLAAHVKSHEALVKALENMIAIYWGDGDGELPEPACIQEARAALASAREVQP